jgi:hypothetical protein
MIRRFDEVEVDSFRELQHAARPRKTHAEPGNQQGLGTTAERRAIDADRQRD